MGLISLKDTYHWPCENGGILLLVIPSSQGGQLNVIVSQEHFQLPSFQGIKSTVTFVCPVSESGGEDVGQTIDLTAGQREEGNSDSWQPS